MNAQALRWVMPLLVLAAVSALTVSRLRESAAIRRGESTTQAVVNPFAALARIEERSSHAPPAATPRNPFALGLSREAERPRPPRPSTPSPAPARERPVLTAIVSDADPRALLRYEGRNYTVKSGDLFAEFRVVSVNADRVVLESGSERIVLNRPVKGE